MAGKFYYTHMIVCIKLLIIFCTIKKSMFLVKFDPQSIIVFILNFVHLELALVV